MIRVVEPKKRHSEERATAVANVRGQQLRVQSLLLPGLREAKFDGSWRQGLSWHLVLVCSGVPKDSQKNAVVANQKGSPSSKPQKTRKVGPKAQNPKS